MNEDRGRTIERHALEKESSELQRKMESLAWRRERAALSKNVEQLKTKVGALQDRIPGLGEIDEPLSEHEAKLRALTADAEKQELKSIMEKLEAEVAILDNECWKYREVAEEMQARMNKLTAQNEELQASSDILTQERTLLHTKLATAQQEKSELHAKFRKDKDSWERERAEIRSTLAQQDMALKDAQCMLGRLQVVKENLEKRTKDMDSNLKQERQLVDLLQRQLKEKESELSKSPLDSLSSKPPGEVPDGREVEMRSKTKQLEELHENLNRANRELDNGKERLRELEFSLRQREHTLVTERLELMSEASTQSDSESSAKEDSRLHEEVEILRQRLQSKERDWRSERSELRDAVDKLQTNLKAREATWESERSKLRADVKSLKTRQLAKEDSWKQERCKFLNDVGELRKCLKARDSDLEKNREMLKRLEAQTELVESYKEGEIKFKEERRRLLQQIEDKSNELDKIQRERDGLQRSLDNQQRRIDHARQEVLDQHTREEKIWKTEISAARFKLEAEAKYFKDELARLQNQMSNEAKDRDIERNKLMEVSSELERLQTIYEDNQRKQNTERQERFREQELVKKSKELLGDFQRDKRNFNGQLAEERNRFDTLQRTYAADKATWDVCRNEMQAKISRLEGQTKQKKVKKDDVQARLQASFESERGEHRRLVSEANHNSLETQRQMDAMRNKHQRDVDALREHFEKERADWRIDRTKINEHMHKLEEEIRRLKEGQKRATQTEMRFQREREDWRRERNEGNRKLSDSLSTRRMENSRIEGIIEELEKLKNPSIGTAPPTELPDIAPAVIESRLPRSKTPPPVSPKKTPPAPPPRTFRAQAKVKAMPRLQEPEKSPPAKEGAPVRQLLRQVSDPANLHAASAQIDHTAFGPEVNEEGGSMGPSRPFEEALKQIAMVQDDLTSYQVRIELEYAARLKRSKSHSDVYGKKQPPATAIKPSCSVREISRPIRQECTPVTIPPTKTTSTSVQILTTERTPSADGLREVKIHSRSAEILTQSPKHRVFPMVSCSKDVVDNRSVGSGPSSVSSDGSRTPAMSDMSETSSAGSTPRGSPKKTARIPVSKTYASHDVKSDRESFRRQLEALNGSHVDSTKRRFELAQKRANAPLSSSLQSSREHSPSHSIDSDSSDRGRHTDSEISMRSPSKDVDITAMFNSLRDGKIGGKATIVTLSSTSKWSPPRGGSPRKDGQHRYSMPASGFMTPKQISEASKRGMEPIPLMRTPPPSGRPFSAPINPQQLASYQDEHLSILPGQLPITKSRMQESIYVNLPVSPAHRVAIATTAPAATTTSPAQSPNKKQKEKEKDKQKVKEKDKQKDKDSPRSLRTSFFSSDRSKASAQSKSTPQSKKASAKSQGGTNNNNNQTVQLTQEQEQAQQRKELQQKQQPLMHEMQERLQKRRSLIEEQMKQEEAQQPQASSQQTQPKTQQSVPQQQTTTTITKKETTIQATKVAVLIPTDPIPPVPQQRHPQQQQKSKVQKQPPVVHQKPNVQKRPQSQPQATSQTGVLKKQQPPVPPAKPPRQGTSAPQSQTLSQTHKPPVKSSPWSVSPSVPLPQQRSERPLSGHYKTNTLGSTSSGGSRNSSGASTPSPESEKKDGAREKPLDRAVKERTIPTNGSAKDIKGEKRAPKISFDEMFPDIFAPTLTAKFVRPRPAKRRPPSRWHRKLLRTSLFPSIYDSPRMRRALAAQPDFDETDNVIGAESETINNDRYVKRLRLSFETDV